MGPVWAAIAYLAVAIAATWPLALQPRTLLGAPQGAGDPYLNLWTMGWSLRQLFDDPGTWWSGAVFDAPIFHPARQTLAYTDHQLLQSLMVAPIYAIWRDPVLCYNALFIGSLAASGWTMWWYLRQVIDDPIAPLVGGLVWGFSAYRFSHVLHIQLQALYFLPLAFGAVHRIVARRRWRDGGWLGLWYGLTAAGSVYGTVMGGLALAAGGLALVAGAGRVRLIRLAGPLALGALVTGVIAAPLAVPYMQVQQREGFVRTMDEASRHAATARSYVSEPPWRPVALARIATTEEDALHPGWAALVLAIASLAALGRGARQPLLWTWGAVALLGFVLSLGPDGVRTIYAWCHRWIFGFQAVRAPARFGLLVTFGVGASAAFGAAWWRAHSPAARHAVTALIVFAGIEAVFWRVPYVPAPVLDTPVSAWLRDAEGAGAVAFLPLPEDRAATPLMLGTLTHTRPIVNGYSGQRPAFAGAVNGALGTFPSADAVWTLHDLGVRFVVTPRDDLQHEWPLVRRDRLSLGPESQGTDQHVTIYELADEATLLAAIGAPATAAAPAPGDPGFAPGEVSRYEVFWDGAGAQVPAGTVEIALDAASAQDPALPSWVDAATRERLRYRLTVTLETAPWVARFFEARDQFRTWTDGQYRPVVHVRQIREGRRRVDQAAWHDAETGLVRLMAPDAPGPDGAPAFRAPADARDPLSAFLLMRTLPLAPGSSVAIPINDMGRNLTLQSGAVRADTIEWQGRPTAALHLRPMLVQRVQRRAPPVIDLWLSADGRRLPLRVDVAAGFGRVRLELVDTALGGQTESP